MQKIGEIYKQKETSGDDFGADTVQGWNRNLTGVVKCGCLTGTEFLRAKKDPCNGYRGYSGTNCRGNAFGAQP